jgi:hypothetical protein
MQIPGEIEIVNTGVSGTSLPPVRNHIAATHDRCRNRAGHFR